MEIETIYLDEVVSTNDEVRKYDSSWTVVVADSQTKGRGQRGNSWESETGKNLTFSMLLKPQLHVENQFYISKIVSLAIVQSLSEIGINALVKWPNDIYVSDKKISGILIENDVSSCGVISKSIIGIGININQVAFLSDAPNPTSAALILGKEVDREYYLYKFYDRLLSLYGLLGQPNVIDQKYWEVLYRRTLSAAYKDIDGEFIGQIVSVAPSGELEIRKESGLTRRYLFKEVEFLIDRSV